MSASLPKARKRLLNKPLPRLIEPPTPVAGITRAEEEVVEEEAAEKEAAEVAIAEGEIAEDQEKQDNSSAEESSEEEDDWQMQLYKQKWQYWRSIPVEDAWKERSCCIRSGFSGTNLAVITREKLKELENCRNVYRHVREFLQLPKHISLALYFVGSHKFQRQWRRHEVRCDDRHIGSYLEGAVLEAVMHP